MLKLLKHIFGFVHAHPTEFNVPDLKGRAGWPSNNAAKGEANPARPGLAKTCMDAYLDAMVDLPNGGHTLDDDRFQEALERRGYRIIPLSPDVGSHG